MFQKSFCTSPWFSMRIRANGDFAYCRWAEDREKHNIRDTDIKEYFQNTISTHRKKLLDGDKLSGCHVCYNMEKHGKVSGRQKQLLKTGIKFDNFKTLHSSTILQHLKHSQRNNGDTEMMPVDWQVDLGNYCNSACVMCLPEWSSRLATELFKIGYTDRPESFVWSEDPECLEKFTTILKSTDNLKYIHFLGGETTMMPAFEKILSDLIECEKSSSLIIGFTTNLTTWKPTLIEKLKQFKEVHVGLSIEALDELNDYIRWPSEIGSVKEILNKWIATARENNWIASIRPTPNLLSISRINDLFEFAYDQNIGIESCHFLYRPEHLRIQGLPLNYRRGIIEKLQSFIDQHPVNESLIVNVRNPSLTRESVVQDAQSLLRFLREEKYEDGNHDALVDYLKLLEKNRSNSITGYLPEYEEFFRSIGYVR